MKNYKTKKESVWPAIILAAIMLAALTAAFNYGLKKQEKIDCEKWQRYEKQYSLFEASPDTAEHCAALGIKIK